MGRGSRREERAMQQKVKEIKDLAAYAKVQHAYWIARARKGSRVPYCLEGAAEWRRQLAYLLAELRAVKAEAAQ
jgi:hypothetical protein